MTDTKTAEERAREIAAILCRHERCTGCVIDRHPSKCNWCPGVEVFEKVFPALNQEHQRGYERGLEAAAEVEPFRPGELIRGPKNGGDMRAFTEGYTRGVDALREAIRALKPTD